MKEDILYGAIGYGHPQFNKYSPWKRDGLGGFWSTDSGESGTEQPTAAESIDEEKGDEPDGMRDTSESEEGEIKRGTGQASTASDEKLRCEERAVSHERPVCQDHRCGLCQVCINGENPPKPRPAPISEAPPLDDEENAAARGTSQNN